jgi:hypothetical protein
MDVQTRKPHAGNAGYVCERKARLGGHIVVYDREHGADVDADYRWIVMHEPSSLHVAVQTEREARALMKDLAEARTLEDARQFADLFPRLAESSLEHDDDQAVNAPRPPRQAKAKELSAEERAALFDRFWADPENEPTPEGKAALRKLFGLDS